jgi:hypothetical protein
MTKTRLLLVLLFLPGLAFGQINPFEYQEDKPPLKKNEWALGLNVHSAGWGFDFRRAKNLTVNKKQHYEIEIVNMKHPKEVRSVNPYFDNARSFFYGKQNTMTVLRLGYGRQNVLFSKAEKGGVEVRLNYTGGFSLGLAKPVYLNILYPTEFDREYLVVVEKYDPEKHYTDNIYGRAPFTEGITEVKPFPGAYAKFGLAFEYGAWDDDIRCIETGISFDAYGKEVPIMALTENSQFYFNFYINILYGRKW